MKAIEATVAAKLAAKPGLEGASELWKLICAAWAEGGAEGVEGLLEQLQRASEDESATEDDAEDDGTDDDEEVSE